MCLSCVSLKPMLHNHTKHYLLIYSKNGWQQRHSAEVAQLKNLEPATYIRVQNSPRIAERVTFLKRCRIVVRKCRITLNWLASPLVQEISLFEMATFWLSVVIAPLNTWAIVGLVTLPIQNIDSRANPCGRVGAWNKTVGGCNHHLILFQAHRD